MATQITTIAQWTVISRSTGTVELFGVRFRNNPTTLAGSRVRRRQTTAPSPANKLRTDAIISETRDRTRIKIGIYRTEDIVWHSTFDLIVDGRPKWKYTVLAIV
jgi:hypothetical protein